MEDRYRHLLSENDRFPEKLEHERKRFFEIEERFIHLQKDMHHLEEDYHHLKDKYSLMVSEHEHDEDHIRKLKHELDTCKDEYIHCKRDYEAKITIEIERHNHEEHELRRELDEAVHRYKDMHHAEEEARHHLRSLHEKTEITEIRLRKVEITVHQKDEEIDILHEEMHVLEREHEREMSKTRSEMEHKMKHLVLDK